MGAPQARRGACRPTCLQDTLPPWTRLVLPLHAHDAPLQGDCRPTFKGSLTTLDQTHVALQLARLLAACQQAAPAQRCIL